MSEKKTYPYKYGELKVLVQILAEDVMRDHNRRSREYGTTPYSDVMTYDRAKRVLKLLEEQGMR